MADADVDDLINDIVENPTPSEPKETKPKPAAPSLDELKKKTKTSRAEKIAQRKGKSGRKKYPLNQIFYCEADGCNAIMEPEYSKNCPVCKCYTYCSVECQTKSWVEHKEMCGKNPTPEGQIRLDQYREAKKAADVLYDKFKGGDYIAIITGDQRNPACMFGSIAKESNVLPWKEYLEQPIFTLTPLSSFGPELTPKITTALNQNQSSKLLIICVLLDNARTNQKTEGIVRMYLADNYTETMDLPVDGKVTKKVTKYVRKSK